MAVRTFDWRVMSGIGGFGGLFRLGESMPGDPILVASADGIGTKSLVASAMGRFDTIGQDLVAMNVDDVVTYGASPLFLLDSLTVETVFPPQVEQIVRGIVDGCLQAGCALLGGEVAEHPGTRSNRGFDLVGFVVGSVSSEKLITGEHIRAGDVVIGLSAEGMRSDGYSLVRKVFARRNLDEPAYPGALHSLGDELLRPSRIYVPTVLKLLDCVEVHGLAHVTGGGIATNVERILPSTCDVLIKRGSWPIPRIFEEIRLIGDLAPESLEEALPIGVGMVAIVDSQSAPFALDCLAEAGQEAFVIGEVRQGTGRARFVSRFA